MTFLDHLFGPPTEAKFAKIFVDALHHGGDDRQYAYDQSQSRLVVSKDGKDVGVVNLRNLHSIFCGLSEQERPDWLKKACSGFLNRMELPSEFEDVKADLRPSIRSRLLFDLHRLDAEAEGGKFIEIPSMQVSDHLIACVVYDFPEAMRFINQENLDTWGVSIYQAMEVARQNLHEQQPPMCASLGDKLYIFETGDAYDGTRMLMLDMIRHLKVEGTTVALPINRDCLMVTGTDDIEGLRMMAELAEKQMGGPRPLCSIPHVLADDEWEAWLPPTDCPHYEKFRLLEMKHLGSEYAEQKQALEKWTERKGIDVFVPSFSGLQKDGKGFSYCVWTKGVPSWLPKTDLVFFFDKEADVKGAVAWGRVAAELADMMEPLDYWPPRWAVSDFPTKEQLERMGAERW